MLRCTTGANELIWDDNMLNPENNLKSVKYWANQCANTNRMERSLSLMFKEPFGPSYESINYGDTIEEVLLLW